jgi:hypothetical protein
MDAIDTTGWQLTIVPYNSIHGSPIFFSIMDENGREHARFIYEAETIARLPEAEAKRLADAEAGAKDEAAAA